MKKTTKLIKIAQLTVHSACRESVFVPSKKEKKRKDLAEIAGCHNDVT